MPMHRRLPKKGFNNSDFAYRWAVVNVSTLEEKFAAGSEINEQTLRDAKLVKGGNWDGVKILGDGEVTKAFNVNVAKVSATAKEKIEKAGGKVVPLAPKTAGA
jgi:large subunit ribosomal protein L15